MVIRDFTKELASMGAMAFIVNLTLTQPPAVQPTLGQSPEQMQRDMADCQAIAKQALGYDPTQATTPMVALTQPPAGGRACGVAKGVLAGVAKAEVAEQHYEAYDKRSDDVKQEYRQIEAKSAATAGAAVGAAQQRPQAQAQAQQAAQGAAATSTSTQAYKSCLLGRGYDVP